MKTSEAVTHFKTKAQIARLLCIKRQNVSQWKELVPYHHAKALASKSRGKLRLDRELYLPK